jgi:inorganic triphosphatase YgiF
MARLKLTRELIEQTRELLNQGIPEDAVIGALGISRASFYGWIKEAERIRAAQSDAARPLCPRERLFLDFLDARERGTAESVVALVQRVNDAAAKNWRAAAWLLERRWPEHWGPRARAEIAVRAFNKRSAIDVSATQIDLTPDLSVLSDEEVEALRIIAGKLRRAAEIEDSTRLVRQHSIIER